MKKTKRNKARFFMELNSNFRSNSSPEMKLYYAFYTMSQVNDDSSETAENIWSMVKKDSIKLIGTNHRVNLMFQIEIWELENFLKFWGKTNDRTNPKVMDYLKDFRLSRFSTVGIRSQKYLMGIISQRYFYALF